MPTDCSARAPSAMLASVLVAAIGRISDSRFDVCVTTGRDASGLALAIPDLLAAAVGIVEGKPRDARGEEHTAIGAHLDLPARLSKVRRHVRKPHPRPSVSDHATLVTRPAIAPPSMTR